jgi:hypothetical protein
MLGIERMTASTPIITFGARRKLATTTSGLWKRTGITRIIDVSDAENSVSIGNGGTVTATVVSDLRPRGHTLLFSSNISSLLVLYLVHL